MRPILLKGHERPLTQVIYNREGDLIFSCAKDHVPTVWYSHNGERIGTYAGHNGAIWALDVSWDSELLLTASADMSAKLWDVRSGKELVHYEHKGPGRSIAWAEGDESFASVSNPFMAHPAMINIYDVNREDPSASSSTPRLEIRDSGHQGKITGVLWLAMNEAVMTVGQDGTIRKFDPTTGALIGEPVRAHTKNISGAVLNLDKTLLITSSSDHTAKLWDVATMSLLKTYETDRPVNAAIMHPSRPHVLLGGGQEAMDVTTTGGAMGKFETKFYHQVFQTEFGRVKGHFGPINTLAIHPEGTSFVSGAEDGFARLHFFDPSYAGMKDELEQILAAEKKREARENKEKEGKEQQAPEGEGEKK